MSGQHPNGKARNLRGAVYLRMSSDKQEGSIEQQREWAQAACREQGITAAAEFVDSGRAGHETSKRAGFLDMLKFCEVEKDAGRSVDVIVCWAPSRFSRMDSDETSYYRWQFRQAGVRFMLTKMNGLRDWEKGTDRLLGQVEQEATDHHYVRELAGNVLRGKLANARAGRWNGGKPPFGYRTVHEVIDPGDDDGRRKKRFRARLVIDDATAPIVRELFRRYAAGTESLHSLCRWLDGQGVRPARSAAGSTSLWKRNVVRRILANEKYLGDLLYGRERKGKFFCIIDDEPKERAEAAGVPVNPYRRPDSHPPIIDRETFDAVQSLLNSQRRRTRPDARHVFPLLGLMVCAHCQTPMTGQLYKPQNGRQGKRSRCVGRTYFRCGRYAMHGLHSGCHSNRVDEGHVLGALLEKLQERVLNPKTLARLETLLAERVKADGRAVGGDVARLEREVAKMESELKRASDRYLKEEDETLARDLRAAYLKMLDRKRVIEAELAEAKTHNEPDLDPAEVIAEARALAGRLSEALASLDKAELRQVLLRVVERIEVECHAEMMQRRHRSRFVRALVYLRPGLLLDLVQLLPTIRRRC
jgi:DNA invertase Pin-like site-specific DNA recombinase